MSLAFRNKIFLPETLNMFYVQARNIGGWNKLRMNLIGIYLELCEQASLSYTSCFLSFECLLDGESACVYYAVARTFCLFWKNLLSPFQGQERKDGWSWVQTSLGALKISHPQVRNTFLKSILKSSVALLLIIRMVMTKLLKEHCKATKIIVTCTL